MATTKAAAAATAERELEEVKARIAALEAENAELKQRVPTGRQSHRAPDSPAIFAPQREDNPTIAVLYKLELEYGRQSYELQMLRRAPLILCYPEARLPGQVGADRGEVEFQPVVFRNDAVRFLSAEEWGKIASHDPNRQELERLFRAGIFVAYEPSGDRDALSKDFEEPAAMGIIARCGERNLKWLDHSRDDPRPQIKGAISDRIDSIKRENKRRREDFQRGGQLS